MHLVQRERFDAKALAALCWVYLIACLGLAAFAPASEISLVLAYAMAGFVGLTFAVMATPRPAGAPPPVHFEPSVGALFMLVRFGHDQGYYDLPFRVAAIG